jgi:hypothetical protein
MGLAGWVLFDDGGLSPNEFAEKLQNLMARGMVGLGEAGPSAGYGLELSHPPLQLNHSGLTEPGYSAASFGSIVVGLG